MSLTQRVVLNVLNVLKPLHPNAFEFASAIADQHEGYCVNITVTEVNEKTEGTVLVIESEDIPYEQILATISGLGGSVHRINEVEVTNSPAVEG